MTFRLSILGAAAAATAWTALLAGCSSDPGTYYMVREPLSGSAYYTTEVEKAGTAVQFRDARTGSAVTLQNSEVRPIYKDDFIRGVAAPPPAPAASATPSPASVPTAVVAPVSGSAGASAPPAAVPLPNTPAAPAPQGPSR